MLKHRLRRDVALASIPGTCEGGSGMIKWRDCPPAGKGAGKGDRHLLCEAPEGPFRQKVPVTFSPATAAQQETETQTVSSSKTLKVAVIGGDGTGPEVAAEGVKVLKAVAALEGISLRAQGFRFRRRALSAHRRNPARRTPSTSCAPSTPFSWAPSAIPTWPPASWKRGCCWNCASSSTSTSTCGRCKLFPGVETPLARTRGPRTSTSSSSARTPKTCTAAWAGS